MPEDVWAEMSKPWTIESNSQENASGWYIAVTIHLSLARVDLHELTNTSTKISQ